MRRPPIPKLLVPTTEEFESVALVYSNSSVNLIFLEFKLLTTPHFDWVDSKNIILRSHVAIKLFMTIVLFKGWHSLHSNLRRPHMQQGVVCSAERIRGVGQELDNMIRDNCFTFLKYLPVSGDIMCECRQVHGPNLAKARNPNFITSYFPIRLVTRNFSIFLNWTYPRNRNQKK